MGIFMFLSIYSLLSAKFLLLMKILWTKNCTGISGKTQVLYAGIFITRYLDIVSTYYSSPIALYVTRITFIALTYSIVSSIFFFYHSSYQSQYDSFRIELLVLPCIVLSLLANYGFDVVMVFWAFSVYLEVVAILPQVHMIARAKRVENIVYYYISILSVYKMLHLMDGIYRFYMDLPYDRISVAAGVVQLIFYCDFFIKDVPLTGDAHGIAGDEEAGGISTIGADDKTVVGDRCPKEEEAMRSAVDKTHHDRLEVVLVPEDLVKDEKISSKALTEVERKDTNGSVVQA